MQLEINSKKNWKIQIFRNLKNTFLIKKSKKKLELEKFGKKKNIAY